MKLIPLFLIVSVAFSITSGCVSERGEPGTYGNETENLSYEGKSLTPIAQQRNNAIEGTQYIDRESYRLQVNGLVEKPQNLTYEEITGLPQTSKVVDLNCVEGWNFTAKWTGVRIADILKKLELLKMRLRLFFTAQMDILLLLTRITC